MLARGKAFRAAYIVLVSYLAVYAFIDLLVIVWSDGFTGILIGICLSVTVFVVLCIKNDAYISIQEKPGFYIMLFSFFIVVILAPGVMNLLYGISLITDGRLNFYVGPFLVGMIYLVTLPFLIAKARADKDDTEAE